ncbi:hypothetical protein A2Y99_03770 [Candidatus Gottesmanbacteria bacterium RBG_13_37_7]|uniref:Glycosyltransferase 2-like domain-containing protein n=1 Tax=Candidatus Gottesmanbacteria bacterium RBG_13_37_7 TaxID=1798369 RepID=A0A1F5YKQ0_9BACT|nr:MAG: hypothetical protein A2Y99_03770 [Candidatus Gottesmanbacteria bacterium RBG_13_37_7]
MSGKKTVEIVIPIYNEEKELEANISKLYNFLDNSLRSYLWLIIIADNASTDRSKAISKRLMKRFPRVRYQYFDQKGRGRAVKKTWQKSKAEYLCYMDVDLSTDLQSILPILDSLSNDFDIAIGSRLLPESKVIGRTLKREILSRVYNIMIKTMFQTHFSDAQCGFKAVTRTVVKNLIPYIEDNAWFFDSELLIIGDKLGYKIFEEPVHWIDNPGSTVRVMKTVRGDLSGLWRLFWTRPWYKIKKI